ncbi:hypothetical protein JCM10213_007473 [Rhodosporidiobolus nylandii]
MDEGLDGFIVGLFEEEPTVRTPSPDPQDEPEQVEKTQTVKPKEQGKEPKEKEASEPKDKPAEPVEEQDEEEDFLLALFEAEYEQQGAEAVEEKEKVPEGESSPILFADEADTPTIVADDTPRQHPPPSPAQEVLILDEEPDFSYLYKERDLMMEDAQEEDEDEEDLEEARALRDSLRPFTPHTNEITAFYDTAWSINAPLEVERFLNGLYDPEAFRLDLADANVRAQLISSFSIPPEQLLKKRPPFEEPEDGAPATRKHMAMPSLLGTSTGDYSTADITGCKTFFPDVEQDESVRFSPEYIKSLDRSMAMLLLAPTGFEEGQSWSHRTRWMRAHTSMSSVQQKGLEAYVLFTTRFFEFCEEENIEPKERFPAKPSTISAWLSVLAHKHEASYVRKHLNGLQFLYQLHDVSFPSDDEIIKRVFKGAVAVAGKKKDERRPMTPTDLLDIFTFLYDEIEKAPTADLRSSTAGRVACIHAAIATGFFGMCRKKDVTVERQHDQQEPKKQKDDEPARKKQKKQLKKAFDPRYDAGGNAFKFKPAEGEAGAVVVFHLPYSKTKKFDGEDRYIPEQLHLGSEMLDPVKAIRNHLAFNEPGKDEFAFSFTGDDGTTRIKLTAAFLAHEIKRACEARGLAHLHGHSMRSGGKTFYEMAGCAQSVIMLGGGWASMGGFKRYQRNRARTIGMFLANITSHDKSHEKDLSTASSGDDGEDGDAGTDET